MIMLKRVTSCVVAFMVQKNFYISSVTQTTTLYLTSFYRATIHFQPSIILTSILNLLFFKLHMIYTIHTHGQTFRDKNPDCYRSRGLFFRHQEAVISLSVLIETP